MIYLIALILILLTGILLVLFYSPRRPRQRRPVQPVVAAQELTRDEISEVQPGSSADQELSLDMTDQELTLEDLEGAQAEGVSLTERDVPGAAGGTAGAEEIPYILEGEPGLPKREDGAVAPALAGFAGTGEAVDEETPEDLAERLDFFFGEEGDAGQGHVAEVPVEEDVAPQEAVPESAREEEPPPQEEQPRTEEAQPEAEAEEPAGVPPVRYEDDLQRLATRLRDELATAISGRETTKLRLLESQLTAVCSRLADLPGSLAHHEQLLDDLEGQLTAVGEELPGFQVDTVRADLRGGDLEVARTLLTEAAQQLTEGLPLAARIRYLCGRLAEEQAEFSAAAALYAQACTLEGAEAEHLFAAGRMAGIVGAETEARQLLERLLAGGDSDVMDQARHELARIFLRTEQKEQAEPLLQQALAGMEQRRGVESPALGPVLFDLATLHESSGQYEQAEPLYRRALEASEQGLGKEHPQLAPILSKLAGLYEEMEQEEQAEPLYERALTIKKQLLGEGHPDIGILLNHLANLLKQRGELAKAEPMFLKSLAIAEQALGADHPNLTVILNNLAELYGETGDEEKAEQYQERAFALFELPGGGGDFVEMEKDEVDITDDKDQTITGS